MYTLQLTLVLVLAFMLLPSTEARYLWNPNEQPQPVVHENSQPFQGDHIISLTPPPSSHNSAGESTKKESPSSPAPSSTHASTPANPKPTSNEHKPAASSKDTKPAAEVPATHASTPAKSETPKGTAEQHASGKSVSTSSAAAESPSISSEASASPTSDTNSSSGSGLVAGIVIGLIALIGSIAAFVMVRRKKRTQREMNPDPFTMGFGSHDPPYNTKAPPPQQQQQQSYYQQPQPSVSYSTPPMSQAPPYQPQPYYTPTLDKTPTAIPMEPPHGYQPQENPPAASESLGIFNVISTYSPTLSDELDIQLGDRIEITVEYDDGWCQGINVTRGNTKGVFPRHCVDQYPGEKPMDGPPQLELGEMKRVSSMYMTYT